MKTKENDHGVRKVAYFWECSNGRQHKTVRAFTKPRAMDKLARLIGNTKGWKIRKLGFLYPKKV